MSSVRSEELPHEVAESARKRRKEEIEQVHFDAAYVLCGAEAKYQLDPADAIEVLDEALKKSNFRDKALLTRCIHWATERPEHCEGVVERWLQEEVGATPDTDTATTA